MKEVRRTERESSKFFLSKREDGKEGRKELKWLSPIDTFKLFKTMQERQVGEKDCWFLYINSKTTKKGTEERNQRKERKERKGKKRKEKERKERKGTKRNEKERAIQFI